MIKNPKKARKFSILEARTRGYQDIYTQMMCCIINKIMNDVSLKKSWERANASVFCNKSAWK
jgi:hypothetical protein